MGVLVWPCTLLLATVVSAGSSSKNVSAVCKDGLILPAWMPQGSLGTGDIIARGLVYFLGLIYLFVGVSIIADRFMASIEVITSKEREVTIKKPNGETQTISVRIWNETVSNLTLMALGSSAPEILLSIIEIYAQHYNAGELGPSTIVGSAAFNMFVIIAICVWAIPCNENRRIKHLRVFFVTMTWSVFAYIWLYIILTWISPGVIDVWEGLLTFLFFPATVLTAYIADRKLLLYKYISKKYRMNKRGVIVGGEGGGDGDVEMAKTNHLMDGGFKMLEEEEASDEMREFEENRRDYIQLLRELRKKHPNCTMEQLELMAREELLNKGPKSRAFYRIQATRKLMGGGNIIKKRIDTKAETASTREEESREEIREDIVRISFDPAHYTVMENVGEFSMTVSREGDMRAAVAVDYTTEDGTANAGSDYEESSGTLVFRPGESHKQIVLTVIDDDVFEEDEHFYVRLSNPRHVSSDRRTPLELATPHIATVMILDDDHGGIFSLSQSDVEVAESVGQYMAVVNRYSGARGRVMLPYRTVDGTAKAGRDFEPVQDAIWFEDNETTKEIPICIVDNESYERDSVFYVELGEPKSEEDVTGEGAGDADDKIALLGKPRLGETFRIAIRIKESREFKNTVDKLFQRANTSIMIGTSSWKEQFIDAVTVNAGDDDDGGDEDEEGSERGGEKMPSCSDYVLHFFTLFWKVLFAFVPPTEWWGGWLCFTLSIIIIGILTAFIGDMASHFGCTIGLRDSVTAVAFVALGTSVPDTFASKVAAVNDRYADNSIGNVTGSNAVNVFLGIGIAWSIAAIYHSANGSEFRVDPGNLAFSVTIFCVCAFLTCAVLLLRRGKSVGGELGGPMRFKLPTTILFVGLWCFYVLMTSLEAYGYIKGF